MGVYAGAWQQAYEAPDGMLAGPSNAMWTAKGTSAALITLVLKARYGLLWNAKLARRYRMQYGVQRWGRPGSAARQGRQGPISDGMCPHCGRPDSTGHILGGCRHARMQAMYIKRHNVAVQLVTRWLRKRSTAGGVYTIMDACKGAAAELEKHKVQGTRLPEWLLPSIPPEQRARLRPDILRILGLPANPSKSDLQLAAANKGKYTVQIVEVGYTTDTNWHETLKNKNRQHWEGGTQGEEEEDSTGEGPSGDGDGDSDSSENHSGRSGKRGISLAAAQGRGMDSGGRAIHHSYWQMWHSV